MAVVLTDGQKPNTYKNFQKTPPKDARHLVLQ